MTNYKLYLIFPLIIWFVVILILFQLQNNILWLIIPNTIAIILSNNLFLNINNIDYKNISFGIIGSFLYILIGMLFIKRKQKNINFSQLSLSFIMGLGICSIVLELLGIFYLLERWIIISVFILLILLGWIKSKIWNKKLEFSNLEPKPAIEKEVRWEKVFYWGYFLLLSLITIFTFYHALFYPETYWDSLIYYLHYGKMIYQEHGFPTLVCAQVGLGLGANYPHLYPLIGGTLSLLFGQYSDIFGQIIPPFAGLLATILIYFITLELYTNDSKKPKLIAISTALIFRSIPFGIAYFTYATDYSLVMLFTAGFLYTALRYLKTSQTGYLWLTGFIVAVQTHINYLGWIFFPLLILLFLLSKEKTRIAIPIISISLLISLPWYLRNWLVTGNPVYSFFPEIFGGKHINPAVLASCYQEWTANGIGVPGATVWERILNAPKFFFFDWRFAPALIGLSIPGIGLFFAESCLNIKYQRPSTREKFHFKFIWLTIILFILGFFYHLVISSLYLYQIIFIIPAIAVLSGYVIHFVVENEYFQPISKIITGVVLILVLLIGLVPGLAMSIMGHKYANPNLLAFRYPGIEKMQFMQLVYGDAAPMWEWINQNLHNTKLLTHDNRYHVYNDDIKIIHLDDWDIQSLYNNANIKEKLEKLKQIGIEYYLFIPNERNHPIVKKLGLNELITAGYLKEIYSVGEHKLYQFNYEILVKN